MTVIDNLFKINDIVIANKEDMEIINSFSSEEPCVNILQLFDDKLIQIRSFIDIYSKQLYEIDQSYIEDNFQDWNIQYCYLQKLNQYYFFFWYNYDPYIENHPHRKKLYVKYGIVDIDNYQEKTPFNLMGLYMKGLKIIKVDKIHTDELIDKDQLYKKIKEQINCS